MDRTYILCGTILLAVVLGGVYALAWHGTFTGTEAITIITTIVALAGGAFAHNAGVKAGGEAGATATTTLLKPPPK